MQGATGTGLPDMLWLCACLGALDALSRAQKKDHPGRRQTLTVGEDEGLLDLVSIALEQAMQVVHIRNWLHIFHYMLFYVTL